MSITYDQLDQVFRIYGKKLSKNSLDILSYVINHPEKSISIDDIEINHYPFKMNELLDIANLKSTKDKKLARDIEIAFAEGIYSNGFILWQHQMAGYFELSKLGNGDRWVLDLNSDDLNIHYWSHETRDISCFDVMNLSHYADFLDDKIRNFNTKIDLYLYSQKPRNKKNDVYEVTNLVGETLHDSDSPKEDLKQLEKDGYAKRYPQVFIDAYIYLKDKKSAERIQNLPVTNEPFVGFSMGKGVIVLKNKVLLKKIPNKYRKMYEFPGARIIDDESILDALNRYIKTTFSVDITSADSICEYFEDPKFLVEYFYLTLEPRVLKIQESEYEWMDINQLEKTDIMPHGINISVGKYLKEHK